MSRRFALAALAVVALAAPVRAQDPGTVEIGAFGRYTFFDQSLQLDDAIGFGGRVGLFIRPKWMVEGDLSITSPDGPGVPSGQDVEYRPFHLRMNFVEPFSSRGQMVIGLGYTFTKYGKDANLNQDGITGLFGLRFDLNRWVSARLDGTADFLPNPKNGASRNWNPAVHAGLGFRFGAGPGDADKDGVRDDVDRCPATPAGMAVDANGCPRDSDGDGVADAGDRCPNTPTGTRVDANGCPRDADGDGVQDAMDRCPNTPAGARVDATGCQPDSDRDGVLDVNDRCSNTPAGTAVDANGCPRDSDGDGVVDANDRCPNTPAGTTVDATGCPPAAQPERAPAAIPAAGATLVLEGVNFATSSAELRPESQTVLDRVAESLMANPDVRVEVGGHTDNTGARANNLRLSQARADAVKTYLVAKGVTADRIETRGYGPDAPVATNGTAAGRAQNRRVELKRL